MKKRQSINGSRARHENPIPNACRIGNIVMSSVIGGSNPGTRELPTTLEQQVANVFSYIRHDVEAAGGTVSWLKPPHEPKKRRHKKKVAPAPTQQAAAADEIAEEAPAEEAPATEPAPEPVAEAPVEEPAAEAHCANDLRAVLELI